MSELRGVMYHLTCPSKRSALLPRTPVPVPLFNLRSVVSPLTPSYCLLLPFTAFLAVLLALDPFGCPLRKEISIKGAPFRP